MVETGRSKMEVRGVLENNGKVEVDQAEHGRERGSGCRKG